MVCPLMVKKQCKIPKPKKTSITQSTILVSFSVLGINIVSETAEHIIHSSLEEAREEKKRLKGE